VYSAIQAQFGSLTVSQFSQFSRVWWVIVQSDARYREQPSDLTRLYTRNNRGDMVPLSAVVNTRWTSGPDILPHFNGFPAAKIIGRATGGYSSGDAIRAMEEVAATLPPQYRAAWSGLAFEEKQSGATSLLAFAFGLLIVFLVLAAQYESWTLPLSVILIVPMSVLSAIAGVWVSGGDNNVFTQISFLVLAGLACKNAILIVEFARHREEQGDDRRTAILTACRIRLRPVLMTSVAFIMGVVPLVVSTGAGAEIRQAMGIAVFAGMLGVTLFGLFLTPVFYAAIGGVVARWTTRSTAPAASAPSPAVAEGH
jgi:gold/copper resistance efflux pump